MLFNVLYSTIFPRLNQILKIISPVVSRMAVFRRGQDVVLAVPVAEDRIKEAESGVKNMRLIKVISLPFNFGGEGGTRTLKPRGT